MSSAKPWRGTARHPKALALLTELLRKQNDVGVNFMERVLNPDASDEKRLNKLDEIVDWRAGRFKKCGPAECAEKRSDRNAVMWEMVVRRLDERKH